ncbi:acyl carrier protein [Aerococcus vaginalis]
MSEESVYHAIAEIFTKRYGMETKDIIPELELRDELGFDSLDIMDLMMLLEDRFDIVIDGRGVSKIQTVQDVMMLVTESIQMSQN